MGWYWQALIFCGIVGGLIGFTMLLQRYMHNRWYGSSFSSTELFPDLKIPPRPGSRRAREADEQKDTKG